MDVQRAMLEVIWWGLLRDLLGEREDIKVARIRGMR